MVAASSVSAEFERKIADGTLKDDVGQRAAAAALDECLVAITQDRAQGWLGRTFGKPDIVSGLYLYGGVGRGKTMLMDMFFDALPAISNGAISNGAKSGNRSDSNSIGWRLHFHDFMVLAQDLIHAARGENNPDPIAAAAKQLAARGNVICFDEMEVRDIADAMIVARLFTGIFDAGVTLVATSNRHADDLYKGGLHRDRFLPFIDLLKQRCRMFEIPAGKDWRGSVLAGMQAWHMPANQQTNEALAKSFAALGGDHEPKPDHLRVAGRDVVISCAAGDVAFVDFAELCDVPLAARDYLVIAGKYAGIVMRNVPQFDDQNEAAARRFMWLVDALYDRSRFLIASSMGSIDTLYQGHHFAFEFSRTLSRLTEMTRRGKLLQRDE